MNSTCKTRKTRARATKKHQKPQAEPKVRSRKKPAIAVAMPDEEPITGHARAEWYARKVISREIPACEFVILACERHEKDLLRARDASFPYYFDSAKAERAIMFAEKLPHVKGEWARVDAETKQQAQRLHLEPWECFIYAMIFGWVKKANKLRRFDKARVYVPRKNGKSCGIAAPIGLFMFAMDGEPGAEVFSGATSQKQAWEVFGPAQKMVRDTPALQHAKDITVAARGLYRVQDMSKFEPIIGKPGDGASPHCSITDEYHEHDTDDQVATMETGMGARAQPLSLIVSTAGDNIAGPCYDDWTRLINILRGVFEDDTTFGIIYTIDKDDDWTSERALKAANPNYGISVRSDWLQQQQKRAVQDARFQGTFKTKHLNQWVQARNGYINVQKWMVDCLRPGLRLKQFKGRRCFAGLDLASKIDLCAFVLLFPDDDDMGYTVFGRYYLPRATVDKPENQVYRKWELEGQLIVTEGSITDYEVIEEDILEAFSLFQIEQLGYDPAQATMLVNRLSARALPVVEYAPTVVNFSEPMKQVEAEISNATLLHNGSQVMSWAMSNVTAKPDKKDNVYPTKDRPENKIDPFVALVMAMGLALQSQGKNAGLDEYLKNMVKVKR